MTGPGGEGKLKKSSFLPSFFVPAFNKSLLLKATSPKGGLTLRSIHSIKVHSFPFKNIFGSFVQKKVFYRIGDAEENVTTSEKTLYVKGYHTTYRMYYVTRAHETDAKPHP